MKRALTRECSGGRDGGVESTDWLRAGGILERWRYVIFSVLGAVSVLGVNGALRITPDAAVHVWIGNRLMLGMDWADAAGGHVSVPRGVPTLVAWVFGVFGRENFWAFNAVMMGFAWACVFLTYRLMRFHMNRGPAVLVAVMLGVSLNLAKHAASPLTDVPFLAGMLVALLGWEYLQRARFAGAWDRQQVFDWAVGLLLTGLGVGVMFWMRTVAITFAVALVCACLVWLIRGPKRGPVAGGLVVGLAMVGVAMGVRYWRSGSVLNFDEMGVWHRLTGHLPQTLEWAWSVYVPQIMTEHVAIAMLGTDPGEKFALVWGVFLIAAIVMLFRIGARGGLWGWVTLGYTLQFALTLSDVRYFLVLLPLLYFAWYVAMCWFFSHLPRSEALSRMGGLIVVVVVTNMVRVGDLWVEQRSSAFMAEQRGGRYAALFEQAQEIYAELVSAEGLVVCEQAHFEGPLEWALQRVAFERGDEAVLRGPGRVMSRDRWEVFGRPLPYRFLNVEGGVWIYSPPVQTPGHVSGQTPGQVPGQVPGQTPGQVSGQVPG